MHNQPLTQQCVYCFVFVPRALLLLIVCCVLPCAVGTAVLCQGHCCSVFVCYVLTHVLCLGHCYFMYACNVLVPQILLCCASRHGYLLQMSYLSAPLLYVVTDNGAAYDCTDVI